MFSVIHYLPTTNVEYDNIKCFHPPRFVAVVSDIKVFSTTIIDFSILLVIRYLSMIFLAVNY